MAISDLGDIFMTLGFEANTMSLKMWVILRMLSISSEVMWELVFLERKGIPISFKYNFDCGSLGDSIYSTSIEQALLM